MQRFIEILDGALSRREAVVVCTVVETSGSTPLKAGAKMLVWKNGIIAGTIGGGNIEKNVISDALIQYDSGNPVMKEYHLLQQQMCCGGTMRIFIEPMKPQKQLIIFGAGHVGQHIAYYSARLDFKVIVVDERPEMINMMRGSKIEKHPVHHTMAFPELVFDEFTYIVICTHLHASDREILAHCLNRPHAYLGMIGSRRKVAVTRKLFMQQQIATATQLNLVDMPMGFDIGQHSPAEIGLGVMAGIVAFSNGKRIRSQEFETGHNELAEHHITTCIQH